MAQATISQLKDGLSAYLRQVKLGESVLIFDRKTPVARLVPLDAGTTIRDAQAAYTATPASTESAAKGGAPDSDEERLARLERKGLIIRAKTPLSLDVVRSWTPIEGTGLVEAIIQERREDYESGYR